MANQNTNNMTETAKTPATIRDIATNWITWHAADWTFHGALIVAIHGRDKSTEDQYANMPADHVLISVRPIRADGSLGPQVKRAASMNSIVTARRCEAEKREIDARRHNRTRVYFRKHFTAGPLAGLTHDASLGFPNRNVAKSWINGVQRNVKRRALNYTLEVLDIASI